jgi:hypothetical protein
LNEKPSRKRSSSAVSSGATGSPVQPRMLAAMVGAGCSFFSMSDAAASRSISCSVP